VEIKQEIRAFIQNTFLFGACEQDFGDDDSFMENGIIDSTGVLELVSFVEERFGLEVHDDELIPDNLDSANKLTEYVSRKIGAGASG
jgi:acyl carrier protein